METATAMDDERSDIPPSERSAPPEACWSIVLENVGLVHRFINDHCPHRQDRGDLVQEGLLGLLEAARRFDPAQQVRFSTYAYFWIRKRILIVLRTDAEFVEPAPLDDDESEGDELQALQPTLDPPEVDYIREDLARDLHKHLVSDLDEVERLVVVLRWLSQEKSTLDEIRKALGLRSESSVLAIEQNALQKLRQAMSRGRKR